ncbi:hypothetical protein M378DRAFT_19973 [Amanita muscaria Koide BX008]|uniref:Uncharacterized protein n=1 Tax=Amanita muscaria (strain Koide BX008) TaxID=946122 RepID=A0A0C2T6T2_AMAMK|nr:hypothetical protein M378DRAFT_19973 [Amanita muscaria Koide BX008]
MNHSIIPRAQQVEVDLLKALSGHEGDVEGDVERVVHDWVSVAAEIEREVQSGSLDESTRKTILVVASRISILSETYLQYQTEAEALTSDFTSQLEHMFSNITLEDSSPTTTPYTSSASYFESSYRWLLQNLHDPYPSKKTKESIVRQTGCPAKDIDSWFVEVRRRIGWNALRRSRFNNKRQSIIEAASRFFGKSDDAVSLAPDLQAEFANIQSQAENLYRHRFFEQPSLLECGSHIGDRCEPSRPRKRRRTPSQPSITVAMSSPSGRSSPESDSRLTDDASGDADSRASSIAPSQSSRSSSASYTDWLNDESPASTHPSSSDSCNSVPAASSLKRKRRLSLSDGFDTPKRPRTGCSGPRPHVVSDPLPLSSSSTSLSPESLFDGMDLPPFLEIDLFNPSELFGSENDALGSSLRFPEPANQAVITPTHWPLVQSQRKTVATGDLSYDPSVVSVVDNVGFGDQILPSNGLPYLDITLDGLPEPLDWLTPFLDETTLNGLLEPNPIFQLDFPPIDDVLALDFSLSSEVY